MTEPSYIRPSDHRSPEEYAEWLQADARRHGRSRRSRTAHRLVVAAALLIVAITLAWGVAGYAGIWQAFEQPALALP